MERLLFDAGNWELSNAQLVVESVIWLLVGIFALRVLSVILIAAGAALGRRR